MRKYTTKLSKIVIQCINSCVYLIITDHMFISQYLICLLSFVILLFLNLSDSNNLNYVLWLEVQLYIVFYLFNILFPSKISHITEVVEVLSCRLYQMQVTPFIECLTQLVALETTVMLRCFCDEYSQQLIS